MQTLDRDQVSLTVNASAHDIYSLISDVTRTPELSPEVLQCNWLDGATGAQVGARFEAVNKVRANRPPWKNHPVVVTADPGREFAFARTEKFAGTLLWTYHLQPNGAGTTITESYEVTEPITRIGWFIIDTLYGCHDRRKDLHEGMTQTLNRIRDLLETAPNR